MFFQFVYNRFSLKTGFFLFILGLIICLLSGNQINTNKLLAQESTATVPVSLAPNTREISPSFFGTNNNALRVKSWQQPEFVEAVKKLNPRKIRFPGGTVANYWDWRYGGLIEDFREGKTDFFYSFDTKDSEYNSSKLADFQGGLELTDTEPIFVLNISTSDLESQLEMLRSARDLGMPVKYIELGNELYIDVSDNKDVYPKPEDYAEDMLVWIDAIQAEFPAAKIALVGVVPTSKKPRRVRNWNQSLLAEALPKVDAITLHIYSGHGLNKDEIKQETYPFFSSEDVREILAQPFIKWQEVRDAEQFAILPTDKEIWLTEYNLFENIFYRNRGRKPKVMGSWTHGLYAATMSLLFLEEPRIEFVCNHQLISNFYFASILSQESSFKDPLTQEPLATPYSLSAAGEALSLFADAIAGMTEATKIEFANSFDMVGSSSKYPSLYGWMFAKEEQKNSLILNLGDRPREIDISSLFNQKATYQSIFGSPRDLVVNSQVLQRQMGETAQKITLPPYSATKLSQS